MPNTATASLFTHDFVSLMREISPLAIIVLYLSMTYAYPEQVRSHMACKACWIAGCILCFFSLTGELFFRILRIGPYTLCFASGIILFVTGFRILHDSTSETPASKEDAKGQKLEKSLHDLSLIPLAIPMIANPDAIMLLIQQHGSAHGFLRHFSLHLSHTLMVLAAVFSTYLLLILACRGACRLNRTVLKLSYRLSGLFIIAMAIQFIMTGIKESDLISSLRKISHSLTTDS
ncbi:MAG: MarC family protein [Puniceicoccales bacterium]|jgi:multiple antibiotic resistance protein|nr:MarC family protein [Puniceicoccales bacterium]